MSSNEQSIIEMLQKHAPYTEIQAKLGVAPKTISAVAKAAGLVQRHRKVAGSITLATSHEDPAVVSALKEGVRELYNTFLEIARHPKETDSILERINVQKIEGAVKYL